MKNHLISFTFSLIILIIGDADAQFGIRLKYNNNTHANWEKAMNDRYASNSKVIKSGLEAGIDYWFRLKKRRIEFLPEIAYSFASNESPNASINKISYQSFHFNFNTQIYALDLEGDCDCPTFSKQGPSIQKGLFFHFTPGLGYYQSSISENENAFPTLMSNKASGLMIRLGIGLGLDLGINDFLTITPILSYYMHTNSTWDDLAINDAITRDVSSNLRTLQLTLRLGFRPDYTAKNGRRRR